MKKLFVILSAVLLLASCSKNTLMPRAVNTVNSITLKELNLDREDYEVLNTATTEGSVIYSSNYRGKKIWITEANNEFQLVYTKTKLGWEHKHSGIMKLGYLSNDYQITDKDYAEPEDIARRLAIYRMVNLVNEYGADGVLEPVISTNVEEGPSGSYIFKTTVRAKLVKIKTNK